MDFTEHIEAMVQVYKENDIPLDPGSIAESVCDILYAQGWMTSQELDLAEKQIEERVEYLLLESSNRLHLCLR